MRAVGAAAAARRRAAAAAVRRRPPPERGGDARPALRRGSRRARRRSASTWEIVYVDDGSTDGSYRELVRLHEAHSNVRVVRLRRRFGKAAALAAGFDAAAGDVIVTIDADLQDDPAEIPNLLAKLDEGYDLVSGWKRDRHDPLSRRILSRIYNRATALVTGVRLHDMNCGLKAYRAEVLRDVQLYGELHRFVPVLAAPPRLQHRRDRRSATGRARTDARATGSSATSAASSTCSPSPSWAATATARCTSSAGSALLLGGIGFAILLYLTAIKLGGAGIGGRPLLMLGILLRRRRDPVVLARARRRDAHEPARGEGAAAQRRYVRDALR